MDHDTWHLEHCPTCRTQVFEKVDEGGTSTFRPIPMFLPWLGGNIDLMTQIFWPTVHPALQERYEELNSLKSRVDSEVSLLRWEYESRAILYGQTAADNWLREKTSLQHELVDPNTSPFRVPTSDDT